MPLDKLRGQLQIHEGDKQEELEKYWETHTGIPISQYNRTIIRLKGNKVGKSRGTFKVRVYNKELFLKLSNLLEEVLPKIKDGDWLSW